MLGTKLKDKADYSDYERQDADDYRRKVHVLLAQSIMLTLELIIVAFQLFLSKGYTW